MVEGMKAPAKPATTWLPHMANRTTRPRRGSPPARKLMPAIPSPRTAPFTSPMKISLETKPRAAPEPSTAIRRMVTASDCVPELPPMAAMMGARNAKVRIWSMVSLKTRMTDAARAAVTRLRRSQGSLTRTDSVHV
jgi:hypothetical protein